MSPSLKVRNAENTAWINLTIEGPTGPEGPRGPTGFQGPQGPPGASGSAIEGPQGPAGVSELNHMVRLIASNGSVFNYGVGSAATFGSALGAAIDGDVIWYPACEVTGDFTVPDGVTVMGLGRNSILYGCLSLGSSSMASSLKIYVVEESEEEANGVLGNSGVGDAHLLNCYIDVENSGKAVAIKSNGIDLYAKNCHVNAKSSAGSGYAYGVGGNVYVTGGFASGSTAPIEESE